MQHSFFDGKSFFGSIVTLLFAWIGQLSLTDWATVMAIGAGGTTILYNAVKFFKEVRRKNK